MQPIFKSTAAERWLPVAVIVAASVSFLFLIGGTLCQGQLFDPPTPSVDDEIERLTQLLGSDASLDEKGQACKKLALLGDERCVPALAALLGDERLSHYARYALEAIPSPAVDQALRDALKHGEGRLLSGVIGSIGERRDRDAVAALASYLLGKDEKVASAAANSLGQIATQEAADALLKAVGSAKGARAIVLHDACLACAEGLAADQQPDWAKKIYGVLLSPSASRHVQLAAALGMLHIASPEKATAQFAASLKSSNEVEFEAAICASRELGGDDVTETMVSSLANAADTRQVQLLEALGQRGAVVELPRILGVFNQGEPAVQIAAIACLGRIGDETAVPTLVQAATNANPRVAAAALESLHQLRGEQVDSALVELLKKSTGGQRLAIIESLGRRQTGAAVPLLLALMDSPDEATRVASLRSLAQTVDGDSFPLLLDRVPASKTESDRVAAIAAAEAASRRMPDTNAVADLIAERLKSWPPEFRPQLIDLLGATGGEQALALVESVAAGGPADLQDAATKVLGQWITPDAAPVLYRIAASDHKFKGRALRGYLRIARQLNLPDAERVAICRQASEIAERAEERRLILEIIERFPTAEGLDLAIAMLADAELRAEAATTAISIAEKIKEQHSQAAASAAQKVLAASPSEELERRARALLQ
ncbi:MAG: HEAT repeat domain-containing protein [Planctomycetes bacterium]|nr:HEAT repeat domain-containing protein [Planctomycetota bacterium]